MRRARRAPVWFGILTFGATLIGFAVLRARILPVARATHQRPYTQLSEVSRPLLDCILASEDRHFYQHSGVDWPALHRAIRMDVQAGQFIRGGSTLTMQATRCAFLTRRRTVWRKLCEVPLALCVDRLMTKDEVLTLYLNTARFGLGPDGIRAASERYFGKSPRDLTLAESAFLAGALPRAPKSTAEVTPEFVRLCRERTLRLLGSYLPSRYGPEELRQAATVPLVFAWERNRGEKPTR